MLPAEILELRLANQCITHKVASPAEVVKQLCAIQAQDFLGSLWAVALRTNNCIEKDIEKAIDEKSIVRTWPMRGTLHYVAPEDVKWMLNLMTPKILKGQVKRFKREFDIDELVLSQCRNILIKALEGGKQLSRSEIYSTLENNGIPATGQRGLHIIWYLAQEGLLCFAGRNEKQPSFALLDEWILNSRQLTHEEALAEIASRYFSGHGPATLADFIWWTGLTSALAKSALELAKSKLINFQYNEQEYWLSANYKPALSVGNQYFLLPSFDEYILGYSDRSLMLGKYTQKDIVPFSNGMFFPVMIEKGQVIGTWKRKLGNKKVQIEYNHFATPNSVQEKEIANVEQEYVRFLGI